MQTIRSAIFVDFDNIYSGLERTVADQDVADRFARDPQRWLEWLERRAAMPDLSDEGAVRRRMLVRRCYLNPRPFSRFRAYFIRAGFEVVDTPSLTQQGKTSADIVMVLDMMDTLKHSTHFDEFIILSGDADFTPVLLRLRMHDRRTTVLAVGPAASAYKASCDLLLDEEDFIASGLGFGTVDRTTPATASRLEPARDETGATGDLLRAIARRVHEVVTMTGAIEPWQLPGIYKEFEEFSQGESWLGYFSLKGMTDALVAAHEDLIVVGHDDWRVELRGVDREKPVAAAGAPPLTATMAQYLAVPQDEIAQHVRDLVAASDEPVVLASLAHQVVDRFGESVRARKWQGKGSFKALLETLDLHELRVSGAIPGFVYDPSRHAEPEEPERTDYFRDEHPELAQLARSVSNVTDTPYLPPGHYELVAREIARQVGEDGFHITETSKAVRDRLNGKGISVARSDVSFLLKGLSFAGYRFASDGEESPEAIGRQMAENTLLLARRAQMELSEEDERRIREWIAGWVPLNRAEESAPAVPTPSPAEAAETEGAAGRGAVEMEPLDAPPSAISRQDAASTADHPSSEDHPAT